MSNYYKNPFYDDMTPAERARYDAALKWQLALIRRDMERGSPFEALIPSKIKGPKYLMPEPKK